VPATFGQEGGLSTAALNMTRGSPTLGKNFPGEGVFEENAAKWIGLGGVWRLAAP
jgi:hypothetical protein